MTEAMRPEDAAELRRRSASDHALDPPGAQLLAMAAGPDPIVLTPLEQLLALHRHVAVDVGDEAVRHVVFHQALRLHILRLERYLPAAVGPLGHLPPQAHGREGPQAWRARGQDGDQQPVAIAGLAHHWLGV